MDNAIDPFLTKLLQRTLRRDPQIRMKIQDLITDLEHYSGSCKTDQSIVSIT